MGTVTASATATPPKTIASRPNGVPALDLMAFPPSFVSERRSSRAICALLDSVRTLGAAELTMRAHLALHSDARSAPRLGRDPTGEKGAPVPENGLDREGLVWMFTQMLRVREFEERVKRTFEEHPGTIRGHTHLADGAEASIVGSLATLRSEE